jgi:hypothetical protein
MRTSAPGACASTSATLSVVVVEYCGYSGSTSTRRQPSARSRASAGASAGVP